MIDFEKVYEEMRPYRDEEIAGAMSRILKEQAFYPVLHYVYPNRSLEESLKEMGAIKSIYDFQSKFSKIAVEEVLNKTATSFSYSGVENLDKETSYLFISNHRDIVLDSAILQCVLLNNGHRTTQITFGSNLMSSQFIIDIGKVNKMFTFYRGGSRVDIYRNALIHSAYIKKVLTEENESAWIAQRDGRTKDGYDKTQISLLKMLTIKEKDHIAALKKFNICPVSISYELEPCDIYKVRERLASAEEEYVKEKDEDFNSILNGIVGTKGRVHIAFGKPVNCFIDENIDELDNNNIHQKVCDEMDRQIWLNYQLNPFNYVAYDILNTSQQNMGAKYSEQDIDDFYDLIDQKVSGETDQIRIKKQKDGLLKMYAAPVESYLKVKCEVEG
ncbi:hypothetical protein [Plebeiibacterium sediminum]|uniref:Acyltransferase n=1 Tax=Plebeiibacterium sediminum TaxID=2992112 RepID=A0AAE3SDY2_9BACT|nr:hypothetical protein [Plebeiobacterium sediminum]MCW3785566.1 hypothetical protein [Plebeiobacterium sediminum]